jgi:HSP20 family molecular chaperone IbpA
MEKGNQNNKEPKLSDLIGGTLNIFGLKLDLGELLSSPEDVKDRVEELREKLKQAGGKEVLSDEEWRSGGASIGGYFRTSGIFGEREYHIGTAARPRPERRPQRAPEPPEVVEPAVDVFSEPQEIMIVAEVPGVGLEDLELSIEDDVFSLSTKPAVQRKYKKEIKLSSEVDKDTLKATCRNGILEVHLQKKTA